jgi:ArsR family transcriptional regulator, lead/cadmium/zinc/bismuth-responsive transcriptional repressor
MALRTHHEKAETDLTPIDPLRVTRAQANMPDGAVMGLVVETFRALADPTRAHILYALRTGRLCVRDLAIIVGVSQSAVSHQMSFLRSRRLVKSERAGTTIYYSLDDRHVSTLFQEAEYHAGHVLQGLPDHPED